MSFNVGANGIRPGWLAQFGRSPNAPTTEIGHTQIKLILGDECEDEPRFR